MTMTCISKIKLLHVTCQILYLKKKVAECGEMVSALQFPLDVFM